MWNQFYFLRLLLKSVDSIILVDVNFIDQQICILLADQAGTRASKTPTYNYTHVSCCKKIIEEDFMVYYPLICHV